MPWTTLTITALILLVLGITGPDAAASKSKPLNLGLTQVVNIDGGKEGRTFDGVGALSAGASSRLLIDYPEPQRSEILDYLFKPNFGASLQRLKVEIGGDVNSTDGSEPSHARTRDELENPKPEYYNRGYEWWLMKEARKRNPEIVLDALQWGAPGWIGNGKFYSQDNAEFIASFHKGARDYHGLKTNLQGIWNEVNIDSQGKWITDRVMPLGPDWVAFVKMLRKTLNRHGLQDVKLVVGEQVSIWEVVQHVHDDPELRDAVYAIGVHYPGWLSPDDAKKIGKPIWDSEDGPWRGDWEGACSLAKIYNRNYISGRMTSTQNWSPITSYYDALEIPGSGLMKANTPWSGHYEVQPAIWAVAHTAQFTKPGWKYIDSGCGLLNTAGSYVTLKSPHGRDYSIIIETMGWPNPYPTHHRSLRFNLKNLSNGPVHVWQTTQGAQFVKKDDIVPVNGSFDIIVEGFSIYTLTTTTGQRKGSTTIPADSARFPFPYKEDFESYGLDRQPKYLSDQNGTFAVVERADGKGKCLRQMSPRQGIEWAQHYEFPWTVIGDPWWGDCEVSADVCVNTSGLARIYGRIETPNVSRATPIPGGYNLSLDQDGAWQLMVRTTVLASGKVDAAPNSWHNLKLRFAGSGITAMVDGRQVAGVTDSTHRTGMVGLASSYSCVDFDDLEVRGL